jgi:hypothetical protein
MDTQTQNTSKTYITALFIKRIASKVKLGRFLSNYRMFLGKKKRKGSYICSRNRKERKTPGKGS